MRISAFLLPTRLKAVPECPGDEPSTASSTDASLARSGCAAARLGSEAARWKSVLSESGFSEDQDLAPFSS